MTALFRILWSSSYNIKYLFKRYYMTLWKQTFLLGSKSLNDSPLPAEHAGKSLSFTGPSNLHGTISTTLSPVTLSLIPATQLRPPLTSPLTSPRTPGTLPRHPLCSVVLSAQNTVPQIPTWLTPSAPSGLCSKGTFLRADVLQSSQAPSPRSVWFLCNEALVRL